MTPHLESPPAVLSAPLEQHARTYIAALLQAPTPPTLADVRLRGKQ